MYNRDKVFEYARKWAMKRNPKYYNFDPVGGDCTNFASQCIFAGIGIMNYSKNNGWYYINGDEKSPSWTGVEFLYNFLISNEGLGPHGRLMDITQLRIGDIVQLSFNGIKFSHTLVGVKHGNTIYDTLIAAHTFDAWMKSVAGYSFSKYRCIHIES